jgi:hypothetical protein
MRFLADFASLGASRTRGMQAVQQFGLRGEHDIMPLPGRAIAECLGFAGARWTGDENCIHGKSSGRTTSI